MKLFHLSIAFLMLVTGSINTIVTKYADLFCSKGLPMTDDCGTGASNRSHCIAVPSKYNSTKQFLAEDNSVAYCSNSSYIMDHQDWNLDARNYELLRFRQFDHPFVQAFTMFIGEFCCLLAFKIIYLFSSNKKQSSEAESLIKTEAPPKWNPIIWALPALCDSCATTSMYVGLTLTDASSFQMLRGSVVIFTGLLSKFWLKRKLVGYHWMGMFLVLLGLIFVGLSGFFESRHGGGSAANKNPILGDAIIIAAQMVVAFQMVVEEKLMAKYKVPVLCAVGWEGVFGMCYMVCFSFLFTYVGGKDPQENVYDALHMLSNSLPLCLVFLGTICSIAFFNFSGLTITKVMSATTRMVLDSVRTVVIWSVTILAPVPYGKGTIAKFNQYSWYQVVGFIILLTGTFVYNEKAVGNGILTPEGKPQMESLIMPLLRAIGVAKKRPSIVKSGVINESSGLLS